MTVCWHTDYAALFGNAFGYSRANAALRGWTARAGVGLDPAACIAVHVTYAPIFRPLPDRLNVLYTMWESPDVPPWFAGPLAEADAIIAPAPWVADLFRQHTDRPVFYVPLGVDPAVFVGCARPRPSGRPFRWLWVGAHNLRKGWREVASAWAHHDGLRPPLLGDPACELYIKTTLNPELDDPETPVGVQRVGNVVVDNRMVSESDMVALYHRADGFVFPSLGEGFGLTLLEAMATALPCVTILEGGVTAFADPTTVRGARWHHETLRMEEPGRAPHVMRCTIADVADLATQMRWVMADHGRARRLGHRAYRRAQEFTWQRAGERMAAVLRQIADSAPARAVA